AMILNQCTCRNCGKIPVDVNIYMSINQTNGKTPIQSIWEACTKEIRACVHCHQPPHNFIVSKKDSIKYNQIIYTKIRTTEESEREKKANAVAKKERQGKNRSAPPAELKPKKKPSKYLL